jgi:hypothetical protein
MEARLGLRASPILVAVVEVEQPHHPEAPPLLVARVDQAL